MRDEAGGQHPGLVPAWSRVFPFMGAPPLNASFPFSRLVQPVKLCAAGNGHNKHILIAVN